MEKQCSNQRPSAVQFTTTAFLPLLEVDNIVAWTVSFTWHCLMLSSLGWRDSKEELDDADSVKCFSCFGVLIPEARRKRQQFVYSTTSALVCHSWRGLAWLVLSVVLMNTWHHHHIVELNQPQVCLVRITSSSKSSPMLNREFNLQVCSGQEEKKTEPRLILSSIEPALTQSVGLRDNTTTARVHQACV